MSIDEARVTEVSDAVCQCLKRLVFSRHLNMLSEKLLFYVAVGRLFHSVGWRCRVRSFAVLMNFIHMTRERSLGSLLQ